jgi:pSer/pThr/pTyr-binding forkhead associated (FHA) protein
MASIATNSLYSTLRQRGTKRDLTVAIIVCVLSVLLLFPAIIWFDLRFNVKQALISSLELKGLLVYITLCGWGLPLSVTFLYCFSALPRTSVQSTQSEGQTYPAPEQRSTAAFSPPRYQPGVEAPFVFGEDAAWAWLEYGNGNFHGQRLALKRAIAIIGRDEVCDIWLDDEMASRYHAEVAWDQGQAFLTDCGSLNGMRLNGQRVYGTVLLHSNDLIEIGEQRFIFILAEQKETPSALDDDPLLHHTWRSTRDLLADNPDLAEALNTGERLSVTRSDGSVSTDEPRTPLYDLPTAEGVASHNSSPVLSELASGTLHVQDGVLAGQRFSIDRAAVTVGSGSECTIVINDASISHLHAQFLHQPEGDYIQDLGQGTLLNNELLYRAQLLRPGDVVCLGNIHLVYTMLQVKGVTPLPPTTSSPSLKLSSGPMLLRLPSRMKQN